MQYKCLSIAGFDGSGGAGLQADLKTFSALGCYGMSVLTALPVQNTQGVKSCYDIPLSAIEAQLETIFEDIIPDAIKIGMLFSAPIIHLVADFLEKNAQSITIVLDPVMMAKSGHPLLLPDAMDALKSRLLPMATIVTPNIPEACELLGETIKTKEGMAQALIDVGCQAVLVKGGHEASDAANDYLLMRSGENHYYLSKRIDSKNTHGTGCTLSAAIAAGLAQGQSLPKACAIAKRYLTQAILHTKADSVGQGQGPVNHFYHLWPLVDLERM